MSVAATCLALPPKPRVQSVPGRIERTFSEVNFLAFFSRAPRTVTSGRRGPALAVTNAEMILQRLSDCVRRPPFLVRHGVRTTSRATGQVLLDDGTLRGSLRHRHDAHRVVDSPRHVEAPPIPDRAQVQLVAAADTRSSS